jgi:hypothetical protein
VTEIPKNASGKILRKDLIKLATSKSKLWKCPSLLLSSTSREPFSALPQYYGRMLVIEDPIGCVPV